MDPPKGGQITVFLQVFFKHLKKHEQFAVDIHCGEAKNQPSIKWSHTHLGRIHKKRLVKDWNRKPWNCLVCSWQSPVINGRHIISSVIQQL